MPNSEDDFTAMLTLISALEKRLGELRSDIQQNAHWSDAQQEKSKKIRNKVDAIDILTCTLRMRSWKVIQLTGPSGYYPQPTLVECGHCGHFRLPKT